MECVAYPNENEERARQTQFAIERGNKQFFVEKAEANKHQLIADVTINHEYSIIAYCIIRDQTDLFFYLLSKEDDWSQYTRPLLTRNYDKLLIEALAIGNVPITRFLLDEICGLMNIADYDFSRIIQDSPLEKIVSFLFKSKNEIKKNIFHVLAKYCFAHHYEIFNSIIRDANVKKKFTEKHILTGITKIKSSDNEVWLDSSGSSPLHEAALAGNLLTFRLLIERLHLSPLKKNLKGLNAFDLINDNNKPSEMKLNAYARLWLMRYIAMQTFILKNYFRNSNKQIQGNAIFPLELLQYIYSFIPIIPKQVSNESIANKLPRSQFPHLPMRGK